MNFSLYFVFYSLGFLRDLTDTYRLSFLTSGFIIIISGVSMFLWPCFKPMSKDEKTTDNNDP